MPWPSPSLPLSPSDGRLTRREWLTLSLGALALTVFVVVVEPGTFDSLDWVRMHSLYKAYIQSSVAEGRLPLWNPHHWLGRPFLADIESAFFYPPEALYLFLELHLACALTCALHLLLLLYGTVKLARALGAGRTVSFLAAFGFALSAPIVGCFTSGLIHYGQALGFLPLVFYLGMRLQAGPRRRDVALLALALGLQVLCGHPQAAWLTEVGLAVLLFGRRLARPFLPSLARLGLELGLAGLALTLGLALAAVALLPLAELASQSNRPEASVALAALFSEPLRGWATLLVPTQLPYFGLQANAQLYAGLLPLLAGVCGLAAVRERNVRGLLAVACFAALLAAGERTPLFRLFFHVIPGVGWLRIHSRATVLVTLAVVLAAALLFSRPPARRTAVLALGLTLVAAGASALFCLRWPGYGPLATAMALGRGLAALVAGSLLVVWLGWRRQGGTGRRVLVALLLALTAVDLTWAAHALKQDNREPIALEPEAQLRGALADLGLLGPGLPPPRVFVPRLRENAGMLRGWSTVYGYSALAPGRVWRHMHEVLGVPVPRVRTTFPSAALDARGPFPYDSMALRLGSDARAGLLVRRDTADPRVYVATSVRQVRDDREATELMRAGHDFHATALVEAPLPLPTQVEAAPARATITRFEPERITVVVASSAPGLLVLAEPWFPGWSARVNGASVPCVPANAWMRAVPVPAGESEVVLSFRSTYLASGAAISLAALVVLAGLLLVPRRRQAR
jgi:hypothetical protein